MQQRYDAREEDVRGGAQVANARGVQRGGRFAQGHRGGSWGGRRPAACGRRGEPRGSIAGHVAGKEKRDWGFLLGESNVWGPLDSKKCLHYGNNFECSKCLHYGDGGSTFFSEANDRGSTFSVKLMLFGTCVGLP